VSYVVNGEVYELVPPPLELAIEIIEEIKWVAGLVALRRRMSGIWRAVKKSDSCERLTDERSSRWTRSGPAPG
jgi:hypothetical protein